MNMRRLRENVRRLRPELWRQTNWQLYRDNTPSHNSFSTKEVLTKNYMTVVLHPTFLFPLLKIELKWQAVLNTLNRTGLQGCIKNGRRAGNGAYARKGTASRAMVASRTKVSF
jgi:hypothetical protein